MRRLALLSLFAATSSVAACSTKQPTAIVVALSTEGRIPDELAELQLVVRKGNDTRLDQTYPLAADKPLPGTVMLTDGGDPSTPRHILVQARPKGQTQAWLVVRRATLSFQEERTKLLRMPLRYSCFDFPCPDDQTCKGGVCTSPLVQVESLPEFESNDQVVASAPPAATSTNGAPASCFDPSVCLQGATQMQQSCTFPLPAAEGHFNLALQWAKRVDLAVLDVDEEEGFTIDTSGSQPMVRLAPGICAAVKDPTRVLGLYGSPKCATKAAAAPVCVPTSFQGGGGSGGAAGHAGQGGETGKGGDAGAAGNAGKGGDGGNAGIGGEAGAAGNAGEAGTAGTGGSTGNGGEAGAAGNAGNAGNGGSTGNGGEAGAAGNAGSAGSTGTGGKAGAAGGCIDAVDPSLPEVCNGVDDDGDDCVDEATFEGLCTPLFPGATGNATLACNSGACTLESCSSGLSNTNTYLFDGCETNAVTYDPGQESAVFDVRTSNGWSYLLTYQDDKSWLSFQGHRVREGSTALRRTPQGANALTVLSVPTAGGPLEATLGAVGKDVFGGAAKLLLDGAGAALPSAKSGAAFGAPSGATGSFAYIGPNNNIVAVDSPKDANVVGTQLGAVEGVDPSVPPVFGSIDPASGLQLAWVTSKQELAVQSWDGSLWSDVTTFPGSVAPGSHLTLIATSNAAGGSDPVVLYLDQTQHLCAVRLDVAQSTWQSDGCWGATVTDYAAGARLSANGVVSWAAMVIQDGNDFSLKLDPMLQTTLPATEMTPILDPGATEITVGAASTVGLGAASEGYLLFSRGGATGVLRLVLASVPDSTQIEQAMVKNSLVGGITWVSSGVVIPPQ